MTIYLDILFLINVMMDFLLIELTAALCAVPVKLFRAILSGICGGIGGVLLFLPDLRVPAAAILEVGLGAVMLFVAFYPVRPIEFLKRGAVFLTASFLISGLLYFDMQHEGGMIKNGIYYLTIPRLFFCSFAGFFAISILAKLIRNRTGRRFSEVELVCQGKRTKLLGFYDSGNMLLDPETKQPAIVIEEAVLKKMFGRGACEKNLSEWVERERILSVPYHTVDSAGTLTAIRLDEVRLDKKRIEYAVAAISRNQLQYPAILHCNMLSEAGRKEGTKGVGII